jgi:hypothetical protein
VHFIAAHWFTWILTFLIGLMAYVGMMFNPLAWVGEFQWVWKSGVGIMIASLILLILAILNALSIL